MSRLLWLFERCFPYWRQPGATTFFFATSLDLIQAVIISLTDTANRCTPVSALINGLPMFPGLSPEKSVVVWLLVVSAAALVAMYGMRLNHWLAAGLLLPQQTLLAITCAAALVETWNGHYADGYPAPHAFILVDQLTRILLAPAYTYALLFLRPLWAPDGSISIRQMVRE